MSLVKYSFETPFPEWHLIIYRLEPSLFVTSFNVTISKFKTKYTLMQILDPIFSEICIFSIQHRLTSMLNGPKLNQMVILRFMNSFKFDFRYTINSKSHSLETPSSFTTLFIFLMNPLAPKPKRVTRGILYWLHADKTCQDIKC